MNPESTGQASLHNDTVINVAALLREQTGSSRSYGFTMDQFSLDEDLSAVGLAGFVRLTRLADAILVAVQSSSEVELECQRCLERYLQQVDVNFSEEFRIAYDVRRGTAIDSEIEGVDERLEVSENHELDFSEPLRQELIVALPMRPDCGEACPGPPQFDDEEDEGPQGQFAALASLLDPVDE
jgi:uncharacterized protein